MNNANLVELVLDLVEVANGIEVHEVISFVSKHSRTSRIMVKSVIQELVERECIEFVEGKLHTFECQPVHHLVSDDPMDIIGEHEEFKEELYKCDDCGCAAREHELGVHNEFVVACHGCDSGEPVKSWESACKEYIKHNAIESYHNPYESCFLCKVGYADSVEYGEEFEPCEDCD